MSIYPESLVKISEASIHHDTNDALKGRNLRQWAKDSSKYKETYIVGVSLPDGVANGDNDIIPAYDFIEKVADAVVLEFSELKNALASSDIKNIFIGKDITMTEDVTIAGNKAILGINSILNLNGRSITLGANNLDAYCKVDGTTTITGTGTVWFKDVLCTSNNTAPITYAVNDSTKKGFERFVDKSDYYTTYKPTGWTQKFVDNTFPWKDLISHINTKVANETTAREAAVRDETNARISADEALQININTETTARTNEDVTLQNNINTVSTAITTETNRATAAEQALDTRITTEINKVYKPKGDITKATLQSTAPSASNLGFVYNITGINTRTTIPLTDSTGAAYSIEVEPNEDVGCVNVGTDNAPIYQWNDFGGRIDLSNYYTKSQADAAIQSAVPAVPVQGVEVGGNNVVNAQGIAEVPAQVNADWDATSGVAKILHRPNLAAVATSGSYNNLSNKPILNTDISTAQSVNSSEALSGTIKLHKIAKTGSYNDLSGAPPIPSKTSDLNNDSGFITASQIPAQQNADWNASSGVAQILNKPNITESKYFLWDTTPANGFDIWANIYAESGHYTAYLPICLREEEPDSLSSAILHTNFSATQQSGITVYSDAMTSAYLTRYTSIHLALSKGLWYYEFAIELVPTQLVSGVADMKINVYSQVYDTPSSIPSYYMIKNINAPISCNIQSTYTRMISGVVYSIRDFTLDSQGFLSFGQTLSIEFDINASTVPSGAAFKFRQTGLHLVKLGI